MFTVATIVAFAAGFALGIFVAVLLVLWLGSINDWRNEGNWWGGD